MYFPAPGPLLGLRPSLWSPSPVPNLYLPALAPYLHLPALAHNLCLPDLLLNLYLPALAKILLPVRDLSLLKPTLSPQIVFEFTALAYNLYYRSVAWICIYLIIGRSSSGSSYFFGIDNTNISMSILAN